MLQLIILGEEFYNEETETFINSESILLELEHSLVSLSKWESIYEKPFLGSGQKSREETMGYVMAMILTPNVPEDILSRFKNEHVQKVNAYIESKQSATTFGTMPEQKHKSSGETITAELIYYWMVAFNIPFDCENWHLNRLLSLVRICNLKNSKPQRMSRADLAARNRALNEQRKAEWGTKG